MNPAAPEGFSLPTRLSPKPCRRQCGGAGSHRLPSSAHDPGADSARQAGPVSVVRRLCAHVQRWPLPRIAGLETAPRSVNYSLSEMVAWAGRVGPHNERLSIGQLVPADVAFAARLHADALPHGFFASLGEPYLRAYYRSFLTSPHACALVARLQDEPIGFVVGVLDPQAHRRFTIRRHGARLALRGAGALLRRPPLGLNFMLTRLGRYTKGITRTLCPRRAQPLTDEQGAAFSGLGVLSHVAVMPAERGSGVGEVLVDAFVTAARRAGLRRIELLTLADELGATTFYDRLGWRRTEELMDGELHFVKFELALE